MSATKIEIDWSRYENCQGTADHEGHTCPLVIFENEDGRCSHHACEGPHDDCGEPIGIDWEG